MGWFTQLRGVVVMVALAGMAVPAVSAGEVKVHLELSRQFYYEQDALDVRVSVHNRGRTKLDNPVKTALVEGFQVRRDDEAIKRTNGNIAKAARMLGLKRTYLDYRLKKKSTG